jgi:hypothetical protein
LKQLDPSSATKIQKTLSSNHKFPYCCNWRKQE